MPQRGRGGLPTWPQNFRGGPGGYGGMPHMAPHGFAPQQQFIPGQVPGQP